MQWMLSIATMILIILYILSVRVEVIYFDFNEKKLIEKTTLFESKIQLLKSANRIVLNGKTYEIYNTVYNQDNDTMTINLIQEQAVNNDK